MHPLKIVLTMLLGLCSMQAALAYMPGQETANQVLTKLFQATGQLNMKQPLVKMTDEDKKVAAYYPKNNTILLDRKAYEVCRAMGKDSLAALAFILGHELAHSFQTEVRRGKLATNFLSYDKVYHTPTRVEKVADIQGVFTAYLAGYRLSEVVPKLLPRLYDAYQLTGKQIAGYPSLDERIQTATEVLEITNTLIDLFETANYLIVAGKYEVAIAGYEYILKYYDGRELHNNLGVLYLLAAMEYYLPTTDRFVHPVELDASTQLKKIEKARGGYQLPPPDRLARTRLLEQAAAQFRLAIQQDKKYWSAKINLLCALNLLEKPQEALDFAREKKLKAAASKNPALAEKLHLAIGISHALANDMLMAASEFSIVLNSKYQVNQVQAQFNLDILHGREPLYLPEHRVGFPESFQTLMKTISLARVSHLEPLELNETGTALRRAKQGKTATFSFGDQSGNIVSVVRFKDDLATKVDLLKLSENLDRAFFYNLVTTPNGYYVKSEQQDFVLKVNLKGEVEEMVRLFVHR